MKQFNLILNSLMVALLFGMLMLPAASVGLLGLSPTTETPNVLSYTTSKEDKGNVWENVKSEAEKNTLNIVNSVMETEKELEAINARKAAETTQSAVKKATEEN